MVITTDGCQFVSFSHNSEKITVSSDVPRGGHLSPLLSIFNILIKNSLCLAVDFNIQLFAHEFKLFICVQSISRFDRLKENIQLTLPHSHSKFKLMSFNRANSELKYAYNIGTDIY